MVFRMGCYQKHLDALGKLKARAWISQQSPQQIQQSPLLHLGEGILIQREKESEELVPDIQIHQVSQACQAPGNLASEAIVTDVQLRQAGEIPQFLGYAPLQPVLDKDESLKSSQGTQLRGYPTHEAGVSSEGKEFESGAKLTNLGRNGDGVDGVHEAIVEGHSVEVSELGDGGWWDCGIVAARDDAGYGGDEPELQLCHVVDSCYRIRLAHYPLRTTHAGIRVVAQPIVLVVDGVHELEESLFIDWVRLLSLNCSSYKESPEENDEEEEAQETSEEAAEDGSKKKKKKTIS